MEELKLGGLKQSLELCKFDLRGPDPSEEIVSNITELLATHKINIEFLTYNPNRNRFYQLTFCINQDKFFAASKILKKARFLSLAWKINYREHVGILTLFPHHSAVKLLGLTMLSWEAQSIPIYGIATSLSAISFITDYHEIDRAVKVIQDSFQLPENRAPLKPEIRYYQSDIVKGD